MLRALQQSGRVRDPESALADVMERERDMATGIENGLAIPHARTRTVDNLVCAIGIKSEGIDFGAKEGPSRIIILTLSPENRPGPHIQFMAVMSRIFTQTFCEKAMAATSGEALYELIIRENK